MTGLAIQLSQGQGRQPLAFSGRVLILLTYQTSPRFGNPSPRAGLAGTRAVLVRSLMVDSHAWEEEAQEGPARHCPLHGCPAPLVRRALRPARPDRPPLRRHRPTPHGAVHLGQGARLILMQSPSALRVTLRWVSPTTQNVGLRRPRTGPTPRNTTTFGSKGEGK